MAAAWLEACGGVLPLVRQLEVQGHRGVCGAHCSVVAHVSCPLCCADTCAEIVEALLDAKVVAMAQLASLAGVAGTGLRGGEALSTEAALLWCVCWCLLVDFERGSGMCGVFALVLVLSLVSQPPLCRRVVCCKLVGGADTHRQAAARAAGTNAQLQAAAAAEGLELLERILPDSVDELMRLLTAQLQGGAWDAAQELMLLAAGTAVRTPAADTLSTCMRVVQGHVQPTLPHDAPCRTWRTQPVAPLLWTRARSRCACCCRAARGVRLPWQGPLWWGRSWQQRLGGRAWPTLARRCWQGLRPTTPGNMVCRVFVLLVVDN